MSRWLITGCAGFIGSNIVKELLERGEEVIGIDDLSTGRKENLPDFKFVEGSVNDLNLMKELMKDVDYVIHLAAIPSVPRSLNDPLRSHEANAKGTLSVLLAAKDTNVKKVVFASSSSVYGNISNDKPSKKEEFPSDPLSPYASMKLYGENLCKNFSENFGLKTISVRYFNVFGPNQDPDSPYSAVIPIFIKKMLKDEEPTIFGDGLTSRDFTYVANVVDGTIKAALSETGNGEVVNIAMNGSITLNELVSMINKLLGKEIKAKYADERPGDVKHSKADISKAKELLGYSPIISFEEGLKKTIEFYRNV